MPHPLSRCTNPSLPYWLLLSIGTTLNVACGNADGASSKVAQEPNGGATATGGKSAIGGHSFGGNSGGGTTARNARGGQASGGTTAVIGGGGAIPTGGTSAVPDTTTGGTSSGGSSATGGSASGGASTAGGTSTAGTSTNAGATSACALSVRWGKVIAPGVVTSVAVTPSGNVTVAGTLTGRTELACGAADPAVTTAAAASFAPADGKCRWASSLNSATSVAGQAIALGPSDTVYVSGTFSGSQPDFGGGKLAWFTSSDATPYVASFHDTAAGLSHNWSTSFPGDGYVRGLSFGTTPIVAGHYYDSLTVGTQTPVPCCPALDAMFAVSLSNAGVPAWVVGATGRKSPSASAVIGWDVAESNGVAYVGGAAEVGATFGSNAPTIIGTADAYLAAYDRLTGSLFWVKNWGSAGVRAKVQQLLAEPAGGVLIAGTANDGTDFGAGPIGTGPTGEYLFVARVSAAGTLTALSTFHVNYGSAYGLDRLPDGRVVLFGTYRTTMNLAGKTLVSEYRGDPFVAVLSTDLKQFEYAETFTTPHEDFYPGHMAISPLDGSIAIGVNFINSIALRCQTFTGTSAWNGLVTVVDLPPSIR